MGGRRRRVRAGLRLPGGPAGAGPALRAGRAVHHVHPGLGETPAPGHRLPPWRRVDAWAEAQPSSRWRRLVVGDGAKGPRVVRALETWVQAKGEKGRVGPLERLVVIRTVAEESQVWYTLSNASDVPLPGAVQAHGRRHGIEEMLQAGKGDVGLGHYEMRSWVGWHRHMTLSLLALWFLILEKDRLGGENPGLTVPQMRERIRPVAPARPSQRRPHRPGGQPRAASQRGGPHLPLVCCHGRVPTPSWSTGRVKRLQ